VDVIVQGAENPENFRAHIYIQTRTHHAHNNAASACVEVTESSTNKQHSLTRTSTTAKKYRAERHAQVHQVHEVTGDSKGNFDGTESFAKMSAEVNAATTEAATMFVTQ
jgi:hypothetical protein